MAIANSCVDRLNAEGGRDRLTQTADRREGTSDVRRDRRAKAGKVEKTEEIGADALLRLPNGRACQRERLAAESTANKDTRLQQMSNWQCERLAAETTLKEMPGFTANERQTDS